MFRYKNRHLQAQPLGTSLKQQATQRLAMSFLLSQVGGGGRGGAVDDVVDRRLASVRLRACVRVGPHRRQLQQRRRWLRNHHHSVTYFQNKLRTECSNKDQLHLTSSMCRKFAGHIYS